MWVDKTGIAGASNLVELGEPSTKGIPRKVTVATTLAKSGRGDDITRIRIPSGMRQEFGDERKMGNGHVSFAERGTGG